MTATRIVVRVDDRMVEMKHLLAQFDGKVLIPVEPVDLPLNQILEIEVLEPSQFVQDTNSPRLGTPQALLEAARSAPHLSPEDGLLLEESIAQSKIPPQEGGIFDVD